MAEPVKPSDAPKPVSSDPSDQQKQQNPVKEFQAKHLPEDPKEHERMDLLKKIGDIVKDYGGLEANIPLSSEYWGLLNQYRSLGYPEYRNKETK